MQAVMQVNMYVNNYISDKLLKGFRYSNIE